jgi:hypothetical protein
MSDELPTVAARVLMRAERISDEVARVPFRGESPPDMPEDEARIYGPLLLQFLRLAFAEWTRPEASATPQNLSLVLMRAGRVIDDAMQGAPTR